MGDPARLLEHPPAFTSGRPTPPFTSDPAANRFLGDPNALLVGLVLDQQIRMEKAWAGPYELSKRLGHFDIAKIAAMPEAEFIEIMARRPSIHRFPGSMGKRVQQACRTIVEEYGGNAENLWKGQPDAKAVMKRLGTVPGIGPTKQRLGMLILGHFYGQNIPGWREASPVPIPS